VGFLF